MSRKHFSITPTMLFPSLHTFLSSLSCTLQKCFQFHTKLLISLTLWSSVSSFFDSTEFSVVTMPSSSEMVPQDDLVFEDTLIDDFIFYRKHILIELFSYHSFYCTLYQSPQLQCNSDHKIKVWYVIRHDLDLDFACHAMFTILLGSASNTMFVCQLW